MVICLERGADLHMAQLMPLSLTVSCFNKIQIGFTFLVPAHPGSHGKGPLNGCVCVCVCVLSLSWNFFVSHDKYIARPSSKEPRWYTDNTTGTGGLRTLDPL